jgi:adenine nucleotide transporter 17
MSTNLLANVFTYANFVDGFAGAMGGCSAISVFYPLNIIRTKLQTDDPTLNRSAMDVVTDLMKSDGIGGLFTGWWAQIVALGCSNFIYFYCYNMLKVCCTRDAGSSGVA